MSKSPAIGIDLGTTYSCVAVYRNGKVEVIANDQGNRITPSVVAFNDIERLIGETADEETIENPTNTIFDIKRLIGRKFDDPKVQNDMTHWPFTVISVGGQPKIQVTFKGEVKLFSPEEISAMILSKMKDTAEVFLGTKVSDAVITVPAYFNDGQRQATMNAGKIAGLKVLRIINEPTAAAVAYGMDKNNNALKNVLIFDLGGGTFDVSILTVKDSEFTVKTYGGDPHLGGEDFNNNLVNHFKLEILQKFKVDLTGNKTALARLKKGCERVKRTLTTAHQARIAVEKVFGATDFHSTITRAKFESLNKIMFEMTIKHVENALKAINMEKQNIDDIVMVGGSTRIPKIQSLLQNFFDGKELYKSINPDEAVAYGASIQAAEALGDKSGMLKDFKLLDVTPLSLGINTLGGLMSVVIPRNTPIPATRTKYYFTTVNNQINGDFKVFEGERAMSVDNNFLGSFVLTGIPPKPRGEAKMICSFNIDSNGILNVDAVETSTGKSAGATIQYNQKRLIQNEIEKMMIESQRFREEDEIKRMKTKAKNDLEQYCLDIQDTLSINARIPQRIKDLIETECGDILEWMKQGLHGITEYESRRAELRRLYNSRFE